MGPGGPIYNENGPFLLLLDCFSATAIFDDVNLSQKGISFTRHTRKDEVRLKHHQASLLDGATRVLGNLSSFCAATLQQLAGRFGSQLADSVTTDYCPPELSCRPAQGRRLADCHPDMESMHARRTSLRYTYLQAAPGWRRAAG